MIETSATATLPVDAVSAFEVISDIAEADWLPAVRGLRHVGGPQRGVGARFEVEAGLVGRYLRGVLLVTEMVEPTRMVLVLEEGLDLTITLEVTPARAGCELRLEARYTVGGSFSGAKERATLPAARREVARAVEQLAAQLARDDPSPSPRR